jgi:hypothetical protein
MVAPAVEGIDLFKIAGRSICGATSFPDQATVLAILWVSRDYALNITV